MDKMYQKFLQSELNLASLGIERHNDNAPYFCTPEDASILGWAGIDGIHFCFIHGFGGMVFSVNPMNSPGDYVHPLSENFTDFLRLILACKDTSAIEQAWMWNQTQFEAFLDENPVTQEQQTILSELAKTTQLTPMERPWAYIKALQADFNYSKIKYTDDYQDVIMDIPAKPVFPEWKVYFDGSFWGHHGRDHAGKEIQINQTFDWAGYHWIIPAAYSCGQGLVIDFCMQVSAESIRRFMEKWDLNPDHDSCDCFTPEQQMQLELENPLCLHFSPDIQVNGKKLSCAHGCSICFNPCLPGKIHQDPEAEWITDYYGLDPSFGWVICRNAFFWAGGRRPEIKTLSLTMKQQRERIPGPHFTVHTPGDSFPFFNPVSQMSHTLTVQDLKTQTLPESTFHSGAFARFLYPRHCTVMSYTIFPEPTDPITIFDCAESDKPKKIEEEYDSFHPLACNACCIGIIGGADGSSSIIWGREHPAHTACSALHFEPVQNAVEWRIVFNIRQFHDASFCLL